MLLFVFNDCNMFKIWTRNRLFWVHECFFKAGSWRKRIYNSKNIQSYINQNNYEGYNVITYPYYSIWDKEEAKKVAPEMWKDMELWIEMQELQQMKQQGD